MIIAKAPDDTLTSTFVEKKYLAVLDMILQKSDGRSYIERQVDLREYLQSLKVSELLGCEVAFSASSSYVMIKQILYGKI